MKKRFAILVLVIFLISFLSFSVYSISEGDKIGSTTIVLGDLNFDGNINVLDLVILVNNGILQLQGELTPDQQIAGDINEDGSINVVDVVSLTGLILD